MGLIILGVVLVVLGGVLLLFPDVTRRLGSRALEIQFAKNVEGENAARTRQIAVYVLIALGVVLIIAGII